MENKVSEILENILGLIGLEGSFEVVEGPEEILVTIDASDQGRLIGARGDTLDALQLIVNQILAKQISSEEGLEFKRVIVDAGGWRKNKEADLERRARGWAEEVLESGNEIDLEPMPSWQRRIVHSIVSEVEGVFSESAGEGRDRHIVIRKGNKEESQEKVEEKREDKAEESPSEE